VEKGKIAGAWKRNLKTRGHFTLATLIYKIATLPLRITIMPLLGL